MSDRKRSIEAAARRAVVEHAEALELLAAHEAMREGPRHYTASQAQAIDAAVAARKPLPDAPLPLEDER